MATALPESIEELSLLDRTEDVSQVNPLILSKTGPVAANMDLLLRSSEQLAQCSTEQVKGSPVNELVRSFIQA